MGLYKDVVLLLRMGTPRVTQVLSGGHDFP